MFPSGTQVCIFFFKLCLNFFFFFGFAVCRILVSQPGIEPSPPALEVKNLNHWTAREVTMFLK